MKKRAHRATEAEDEAEEQRLTALLFGGSNNAHKNEKDTFSNPKHEMDDEQQSQVVEQVVPSPSSDMGKKLFEIDRTGVVEAQQDDDHNEQDYADEHHHDEELDDDDDDEQQQSSNKHNPPPPPPAAWFDEDDDHVEVNLMNTSRLRKLRTTRDEEDVTALLDGSEFQHRLRQRFTSTTMVNANTDWARVVSQDDLPQNKKTKTTTLSSTASLLASSSHKLPPHILNVVRCPDVNQSDPNQSVVQAVHFHPGSDPDRPLVLTAGLDKTLRFFLVDGETNEKIHGIHFPKLPIYSAAFLGNTDNVVVSGRRPFYYIYDTAAGKLDMIPRIVGREERSLEKFATSPDGRLIAFLGNDGYILLVDSNTKHWIADLKMNGSVRAVTFTPDGDYILASGSDGDVYRWEVRTRRCVERFSNQDGTITASLSASTRHLAVGAESGVVNLYQDRISIGGARRQLQQQPQTTSTTTNPPLLQKSIMNLHTSADLIKFNHDGQILAMSTRREQDHGMKLLHVPSSTIFSNWPTSKTPLNYVWSMDFSPQSKFLAVGNDKGKCLLYRLLHYDQES